MHEVYGQPPVVGYTVTVEEARTDFTVYEMLYKASQDGKTMAKDQLQRYMDLLTIFGVKADG